MELKISSQIKIEKLFIDKGDELIISSQTKIELLYGFHSHNCIK